MSETTWADWMLTDKRVPTHLRITVLAYRHADETETLFLNPGELGRLVGVADRKMLHKAVLRAVEAGFLAEPSGTTALRLAARGAASE